MLHPREGLKGLRDREKWAARGASFVARLKATKLVWFPADPVKAGSAGARTAKKTTRTAAKKSTGAARKTPGGAKKTAGAARKTAKKAGRTKSAAKS